MRSELDLRYCTLLSRDTSCFYALLSNFVPHAHALCVKFKCRQYYQSTIHLKKYRDHAIRSFVFLDHSGKESIKIIEIQRFQSPLIILKDHNELFIHRSMIMRAITAIFTWYRLFNISDFSWKLRTHVMKASERYNLWELFIRDQNSTLYLGI